jgi:GNAT superfamily N-acetyltransferase
MNDAPYSIRRARPDDLEKLAGIERRAASLFASTPHAVVSTAPTTALDFLEQHHRTGAIWVAVDAGDEPVGFAVGGESEGSGYLHELDVDPLHGRQGLGRRLVEAVCDWAAEMGYGSVMLSTFVDVAWNAPFYARIGFEVVAASEFTATMERIRNVEEQAGLSIERRVFMKRALR